MCSREEFIQGNIIPKIEKYIKENETEVSISGIEKYLIRHGVIIPHERIIGIMAENPSLLSMIKG